jgi:hypothetical protein
MFNDDLFTLGTPDGVSLKTAMDQPLRPVGQAPRRFAATIGDHSVQLA